MKTRRRRRRSSSTGASIQPRFASSKVDKEYQRPLGERAEIFEALKQGKIVPEHRGRRTWPGIMMLRMAMVIIRSPAYIIDGWQRVGERDQAA